MTTPAPDDLSDWPNILRRLVGILGKADTLKLASVVGGVDRIYIPREPTQSHLWRRVLGDEQWRAVVAELGGEHVALPRGVFIQLRKREILELAEQGVPHREIALRVHVGQRYVRRVLHGLPIAKADDPRQGKLFE